MFMSKKLQNIHLIIIPILFLITLIYSIVTLCTKRDSQNWYSFVGQIVLVAVWIFANIVLKKVLKNNPILKKEFDLMKTSKKGYYEIN